MLLSSAWDRFDRASWASVEPLSARRRRRGRDLEGKALFGRDGDAMISIARGICEA